MSIQNHPNFHAVNFATTLAKVLCEFPLPWTDPKLCDEIEQAYYESIEHRGIDARTAPSIKPLLLGFIENTLDTTANDIGSIFVEKLGDFVFEVEQLVDDWQNDGITN